MYAMSLCVGQVEETQDTIPTLKVIFNDRFIIDFIKCSA